MNKIYALKYSVLTGGLVAVSELVKKVASKSHKKLVVITAAFISTMMMASPGSANQLYMNNVWSRDYFDLAQNKGGFKAGAENVSIDLKDGTKFVFPTAIPDFSPTDATGANTSIGGAYSVTAKHVDPNQSVISKQTWGQTNYRYIAREVNNSDFSVSRLHKFVVETTGLTEHADVNLSLEDALERYGIDTENGRQIIGFRAGAGQLILNGITQTTIQNTPETLTASLFTVNWNSKTANNNYTTFRNDSTNGDSGSGYYIWDNKLQKWVILGTHYGLANNNNTGLAKYNPYDEKLVESLKKNTTIIFILMETLLLLMKIAILHPIWITSH